MNESTIGTRRFRLCRELFNLILGKVRKNNALHSQDHLIYDELAQDRAEIKIIFIKESITEIFCEIILIKTEDNLTCKAYGTL